MWRLRLYHTFNYGECCRMRWGAMWELTVSFLNRTLLLRQEEGGRFLPSFGKLITDYIASLPSAVHQMDYVVLALSRPCWRYAIGTKLIKQSKGKSKVHPMTGHEGPEGKQMYRPTLCVTSTLDGGGCSTPCPCRFTPRKDPVPIV
jgi:hypothetical protein